MHLPTEDTKSEQQLLVKEQSILLIGKLLSGHKQVAGQCCTDFSFYNFPKNGSSLTELEELIRFTRPFLNMISKAKAAKMVKQLVDFYLDMNIDTGKEVRSFRIRKSRYFLLDFPKKTGRSM